ncbi:MAG: helix-turn-helix domain-containing protein [Rhodobacteraceae bacterium]|nr:helix-turn-helix domain-containing protein [Paracoccaceae bacterium]
MKPTPKHQSMANFFDALGHPRRQMIFQILKETGPKGVPFHSLLMQSSLTASTLSFHLQKLDKGRLLKRKTKGRESWISLDLRTFFQFVEPARDQVKIRA